MMFWMSSKGAGQCMGLPIVKHCAPILGKQLSYFNNSSRTPYREHKFLSYINKVANSIFSSATFPLS